MHAPACRYCWGSTPGHNHQGMLALLLGNTTPSDPPPLPLARIPGYYETIGAAIRIVKTCEKKAAVLDAVSEQALP